MLLVAAVVAIATTGATCQRPWGPDVAPPGVVAAPRVDPDAPRTVEVPDLTRGLGVDVDVALGELDRLGLAVSINAGVAWSSQDPPPVVIAQWPRPGARVAVGSTVRVEAALLMLATPICPPDVPVEPAGDVRGHLLSEAVRVVPGGWSLADTPDVPPTLGLRQLFDAYVVVAQAPEDCGVTRLTVALAERPGPAPLVTVPDLTVGLGLPVDDALERLDVAGLAVAVDTRREGLSNNYSLEVIAQRSRAGARVPAGTTVRIALGNANGEGTPYCLPGLPMSFPDHRGDLLSVAFVDVQGPWEIERLPPVPPTRGLRDLAAAYVVVGQRYDPGCGSVAFEVAPAERDRTP